MTKIVKVAAAAIVKDGKMLLTRRGSGEHAGRWELPGGKLEEDESAQEACLREIKEELDLNIAIKSKLTVLEYDYPSFHLSMDIFLCSLHDADTLSLSVHDSFAWADAALMDKLPWIEADLIVLPLLKEAVQTPGL